MKYLLVDTFNLFIRCFSVNTKTDNSGLHIGGVAGSLVSLYSFCKTFEPDFVFLCYEGMNSGNKRRKSFHQYKDGRRSPHSISNLGNVNLTTDFWNQLQMFQDVVSFLPVCPISLDYLEGDDIISYLAHKFPDDNKIIVSTDKDYYQLINEKTQQFDPNRKVLINEDFILEKYAVSPNNWLIAKSFLGDSSDNVQKIPKIGIKTLNKLFPELKDRDFSDMQSFIDFQIEKNDEKINKILSVENTNVLKNNYDIMNLNDINRIFSLRNIDGIKNVATKWEPDVDFVNLELYLRKNSINLEFPFSSVSYVFRRLDHESQKSISHIRQIWN